VAANASCTAGSTTTALHIPTLPMVLIRSETASRSQAYGVSVTLDRSFIETSRGETW
jgi:hypothetical protein